jgi:uncharacterized protein YaiL (DUF2058 family)
MLFDLDELLVRKVQNVLESSEEVEPTDSKKVLSEKDTDLEEDEKFFEKDEKKISGKSEKIIFNPMIEPDKIAEPDKNQRTV